MVRTRIAVVTHSPSPYQVELFDAVAQFKHIELKVIYLFTADPARLWARLSPRHDYFIASDETALPSLLEFADSADLLVMGYYRHTVSATLLARRAQSRKPWVFWGERPGFHQPLLGRVARAWHLRKLHHSSAPIWGIGQFAIDQYRKEFGIQREYANIPYFSDLARFTEARRTRESGVRRILYSGTLIPRKGVDLLARAFRSVAVAVPNVHLTVMGAGPLLRDMQNELAPLQDRVRFAGFKDWNDLPAEYAQADVLCVPSRHDGWGLVVPEGLASGLPVIATNRMGAAIDLLVNGINGWITTAGSEQSLREALHAAASLSDQELDGMASAALNSVESHSLTAGAAKFVAASAAALEGWQYD